MKAKDFEKAKARMKELADKGKRIIRPGRGGETEEEHYQRMLTSDDPSIWNGARGPR